MQAPQWHIHLRRAIPIQHRHSVAGAYTITDAALSGGFIFRLIDCDKDVASVARMATASIIGPLTLVKLRKKGPHTYGLHEIMMQMQTMEGSANAGNLLAQVDDDANKLHPIPSVFLR